VRDGSQRRQLLDRLMGTDHLDFKDLEHIPRRLDD
jgi:hypothetical protein